jgi:2-polyprenyl-6-methoxyphenol hydroxylase-like FAD-dependent oxidoreductase
MKVVIIGGGIAGLTLARFLLKEGREVVICERAKGVTLLGHAFLMHTDGLEILKELADEKTTKLPGKSVNTFSLKRPDRKEIMRVQLDSWNCIKRRDMISYLLSLIPAEKIKGGRAFSHFVYDQEKIVAAAFLNGDVEYGDIFVGADGGNSKVRELICGKVKFTDVEVKEVVGVCHNEKVAKLHTGQFTKYQSKTEGLAFGMIPTGDDEFVWFMQYNPAVGDVPDACAEDLKLFCKEKLQDFPAVVHELLDSNDFETTYIWNTRDFDLLPLFHKKNVVLIGDAAHLALPFTSAGTTNAILDAKIIARAILENEQYDAAFQKYYELRSQQVSQHIILGRELKKLFLNPLGNDDDIPVPLIAHETNTDIIAKGKPIQIVYFTDPICSTC